MVNEQEDSQKSPKNWIVKIKLKWEATNGNEVLDNTYLESIVDGDVN